MMKLDVNKTIMFRQEARNNDTENSIIITKKGVKNCKNYLSTKQSILKDFMQRKSFNQIHGINFL